MYCGSSFTSKSISTLCQTCANDGSECCTAKKCGDKDGSGLSASAVTCSNAYIAKAASTSCSLCLNDGNECCTVKTCSIGSSSMPGNAVTCSRGFVQKTPSITTCSSCKDDGDECCLVKTCGAKTGQYFNISKFQNIFAHCRSDKFLISTFQHFEISKHICTLSFGQIFLDYYSTHSSNETQLGYPIVCSFQSFITFVQCI